MRRILLCSKVRMLDDDVKEIALKFAILWILNSHFEPVINYQ